MHTHTHTHTHLCVFGWFGWACVYIYDTTLCPPACMGATPRYSLHVVLLWLWKTHTRLFRSLFGAAQVLEILAIKSRPNFGDFRIADTIDGGPVPHPDDVVIRARLFHLRQSCDGNAARNTPPSTPPSPTFHHAGGGWRKLQQGLKAFVSLLRTSGGLMAGTFPYVRHGALHTQVMVEAAKATWESTVQQEFCQL